MNIRENLDRYLSHRAMAVDRPERRRSRSPPSTAQPLGYRPSPFFAPPRLATTSATSRSGYHHPDWPETYATLGHDGRLLWHSLPPSGNSSFKQRLYTALFQSSTPTMRLDIMYKSCMTWLWLLSLPDGPSFSNRTNSWSRSTPQMANLFSATWIPPSGYFEPLIPEMANTSDIPILSHNWFYGNATRQLWQHCLHSSFAVRTTGTQRYRGWPDGEPSISIDVILWACRVREGKKVNQRQNSSYSSPLVYTSLSANIFVVTYSFGLWHRLYPLNLTITGSSYFAFRLLPVLNVHGLFLLAYGRSFFTFIYSSCSPSSTSKPNCAYHPVQTHFIPFDGSPVWTLDRRDQPRPTRAMAHFRGLLDHAFNLTEDNDTIHRVANQWRRFYDVLALHHRDQLPHRRPFLPHPQQSNTHFEQPASVIPDHMQILQACWGHSARRHSQGNPSLSSLMMTLPPTGPPTSSPRLQQQQVDPVPQTQDAKALFSSSMDISTSGTSSQEKDWRALRSTSIRILLIFLVFTIIYLLHWQTWNLGMPFFLLLEILRFVAPSNCPILPPTRVFHTPLPHGLSLRQPFTVEIKGNYLFPTFYSWTGS